ncbi:5109_t:CDS:1, partial [Dentiscutata heterogama]
MTTTECGNYIWCEGELQTIEHFILECPTSQRVWNIGYRMLNNTLNITIPTSINDIISPTQLPSINVKRAIKWLNLNIVYEIWCLYASSKWCNNTISTFNITSIVTHHLNRELNVLQQLSHTVNKGLPSTLKFLKQ